MQPGENALEVAKLCGEDWQRWRKYAELVDWFFPYVQNPVVLSLPWQGVADAIVVLSGPGKAKEIDWPEDRCRINAAAKFLDNYCRMYQNYPCRFVLNGATEQEDFMRQLAHEAGVADERVDFVDAGPDEKAHTGTQAAAMAGKYRSILAFTSYYHVPRGYLTLRKHLPDVIVAVVPVKPDELDQDYSGHVHGEVRRIIQYSAGGQIADPAELPEL